MPIKFDALTKNSLKTLETELGTIYFFQNYIITNFKEGTDLDFNSFYPIAVEIGKFYWKRPFGIIANRENEYAINLKDAEVLNMAFPNLKAYAIIAYNQLTQRVIEVEEHFFKFNRNTFNSIEEGISWVEKVLEQEP